MERAGRLRNSITEARLRTLPVGGYGATAVAFVCDESHADMAIQAERHGVRSGRDSTMSLRR